MKKIIFKLLGAGILIGVITTFFFTGCIPWENAKVDQKPLVIKAEDFSIFLFESSEEIYRANVKSPAMWAGLREQADRDMNYATHYRWLYDTYAKWDDHRRAQLNEIMTNYLPQPMAEKLIQKGKQSAGLDGIIQFIKEDRFFSKNRSTLVDFYSWYGTNYALPHYNQVLPLMKQKADAAAGRVDKDFDIIRFMEKETGIRLKEKPDVIELMINMRLIGASGFSRKNDSLYTIRWNSSQEKIWSMAFNELNHQFFRTFTGGWSFKSLAGKLKKDEKLMNKFKEDVPYTWEGWIEANLTEGFARYLSVRAGIAENVGEGIYIFDYEYAQALVNGFNVQETSLKDFTVKFLKEKYKV